MSKKSLTKPSRVSIAPEPESPEPMPIAPRIRTKQDVIHLFFDQMLEMIVDDFTVIEPEEPVVKKSVAQIEEFPESLLDLKPEDLTASHVRIITAKSDSKHVTGSNKALTAGSSKHLVAESNNKASTAGSSKHLVSGSNKPSTAGSSKHLVSGSNKPSTAGSSKHLVSGSNKALTSESNKLLTSESSKLLTSGTSKHLVSTTSSKRLLAKTSSGKVAKSEELITSSVESNNSIYNVLREEYDAKIVFKNGGIYEGRVRKKIMHGSGKFVWPDGTIYEGNFEDGFPNGSGVMTLPDLAYFIGQFRNGFFHGQGFLNIVASTKFYNGQWRNGKKEGTGWLLYEPNDWYDGHWFEDQRHGTGIRYHKNGTKYKGEWYQNNQQGIGTMIWPNNDYYHGKWYEGLMHGTGKYIWKAFTNSSLAFPIKNFYYGAWETGKRCGFGTMHFGAKSGAVLKGRWDHDFKHGAGYLVCGNGFTVYDECLFDRDQLAEHQAHKVPNFPIFNVAEGVDVGFYIEKIFDRLPDVQLEKLAKLKKYEEKYMRHAIIVNLPKLTEVYEKYARIGTDDVLNFEPVLVRLFLWQLFKDMELPAKFNISLIDLDGILFENPASCLETLHYPFEPIYFWQFLLVLIGTALVTCNMEEVFDYPNYGGVSAFIFKKFLEEHVYTLQDSKNYFNYMNLAPMSSMYELYKTHGEPHTARMFLNNTCVKKRREAPCKNELYAERDKPVEIRKGNNVVGLDNDVTFVTETTELDDSSWTQWRILKDFRRLGPRKILECLKTVAPVIKPENDITTIDYPLTFLEFYETLLQCIWVTIDIEMKREKLQYLKVLQEIRPKESPPKRRHSSKSEKPLKSIKSEGSKSAREKKPKMKKSKH